MGIPKIDTGPMTVDEFYAFTDARPDEEKWELIDGEAVLNASPAFIHQKIAGNVLFALMSQERARHASWTAIPGIGALVSNTSRPEPDIMVLPKDILLAGSPKRDTREAIVLFEVMSPSTKNRDLKWKRAAYASLPILTHYVVIAQNAVDVVVFARDNSFAETRLKSLKETIEFPVLDMTLSLSEIYRDTGLGS
jgi:Uma2 family endonuclease